MTWDLVSAKVDLKGYLTVRQFELLSGHHELNLSL